MFFKDIKDDKLNIFEVGIGSVDENVPWNMTSVGSYKPLSSLREWKEYFEIQIFFRPILIRNFKNEDRIRLSMLTC